MTETDETALTRREDMAVVHRAASFEPTTFDAGNLTVDVTWSTGSRVQRADWWTGETWIEELSMDPSAIDLSRLNNGAPLLNTHGSYDLCDQIGVVERAWLDNGIGRATVRFSPRADVAPIAADVKAGIIRNLSVGYRVNKWVTTEKTDGQPKVKRAENWTPYEISFVPIPADAGAQVRSIPPTTQDASMTTTETTTTTATPAITVAQPETRAAQATTTQAAAAVTTGADVRLGPVTATLADLEGLQQRSGLGADFVLEQLRANATMDQARDAVINTLAIRANPPNARPNGNAVIVRDERDTLRMRMVDGLFAGLTNQKPEDHAREFVGLSYHGLMREFAQRAHIPNVHRMGPSDLFDSLVRNIESSSDFSYVLVNSTNKILHYMFTGYVNTWSGWTYEYEVPDFKQITSASISNFPEPGIIAENQLVPLGSLSDAGEQFSVDERSIRIALSRKAIVNDDLRALDRAIRSVSLGSANALRRAVYGVLTTNYASTPALGQTMADGSALCLAAHNNIGTSGALTAASYGELRKLMLQQKDLANAPVPPPSQIYMLVGPKYERTALELTSNILVPTAVGNALPLEYRTSTTVVQDPFIGLNATTGAALATEPFFLTRADVPPVEIAYLTNRRTPSVQQDQPIDTTGVQFRVDFPFKAYATEYRSIAGNYGA